MELVYILHKEHHGPSGLVSLSNWMHWSYGPEHCELVSLCYLMHWSYGSEQGELVCLPYFLTSVPSWGKSHYRHYLRMTMACCPWGLYTSCRCAHKTNAPRCNRVTTAVTPPPDGIRDATKCIYVLITVWTMEGGQIASHARCNLALLSCGTSHHAADTYCRTTQRMKVLQ